MKAKKNLIVIMVLLAVFLAVVQVTQVAGKAEQEANTTLQEEGLDEYIRDKNREILAGLQGVAVSVEYFEPEAEKYGFNTQQFKTDVELRLRQYGVKVFSKRERLRVTGMPLLYINVGPLISENENLIVVGIVVKFYEGVMLERNPSISTLASTWNKGMIQSNDLNSLDKVRESVRDLVDMFINDYLAANPKEQPPQQKTEK